MGEGKMNNPFLEDGGCTTAVPWLLAKSNLEQTTAMWFVYTGLNHRSLHSQSFKFKLKWRSTLTLHHTFCISPMDTKTLLKTFQWS